MCVSNNFKKFNHLVNFDFCLYSLLLKKIKWKKCIYFILLSFSIYFNNGSKIQKNCGPL